MKNKQQFFIILLVLIFAFTLCSCQSDPNIQSASSEPSSTASGGDLDLSDPTVGLKDLSNYSQTLTISAKGTLNGKPYESNETLQRTSAGENEMVDINDSTTDNSPVDFQYARIDGYRYSIDGEGSPCQIAPIKDEKDSLADPASRLPAVHAAVKIGSEEINGVAVLHYKFDETNVKRQSGKNDHAQGEFWMAEDGGYLVKYELSAEISSDTFTGTRRWSYELNPSIGEDAVRLPDSCQPMLTDLPKLQDAADTVMQPGFQQYFTAASRSEVIKFYNEALPPLGWQVLPGSKPEEMDLTSAVQTPAFTRETPAGATLLVIRLDETDSRLRITAQTAALSQVVPIEPTGITPTPETEDTPPASPSFSLPDDLPEYPGAVVVNQTDTFLMLETDDPLQDAAAFYKAEMPVLDWTFDGEMNQSGIVVQSWVKPEVSLVITLTESQGKTQIMIAVRE
jgi:hypothetical protein